MQKSGYDIIYIKYISDLLHTWPAASTTRRLMSNFYTCSLSLFYVCCGSGVGVCLTQREEDSCQNSQSPASCDRQLWGGWSLRKTPWVHLCHQHLQLQHSHARSFLDCLLIAEIWHKKGQNVFASSHQCTVVKTKLCCSSWGQRSVWIWYLNWKDLLMSWYGSLPL